MWEDTFYFQTEADVVQANILYMLCPVNNLFSQSSRTTFPRAKLIFKAEESVVGSRFDFGWVIQAGDKPHKLAILEITTLLPLVFKSSNLPMRMPVTGRIRFGPLPRTETNTLFEGDSLCIMKQLAKYAAMYIALTEKHGAKQHAVC